MGGEKRKCVACQRGLIGAAPLPGHGKPSSHRTRCTQRHLAPADFPSRRTLFFALPPPLQLFTLPLQHFFFLPGERQDCHRHSSKKKKKKRKGAVLPSGTLLPPPPLPNPPGFFQLFGGQPGSLGQSTMVWTENFCYVERRGWGTRCSALHGNQMKALSVELNLHSKSPYGADYHTWEREG